MKTTKTMFRHILPLLTPVLLLWTGCGQHLDLPEGGIPDHCIELTLGGLHPSLGTKATIEGDDAYNENRVESVDCFFYPDGQTGSPAVFTALGRGADVVRQGDETVYKVRVFFTDDDALKMFGNKESGTCQFFVICNAPLSYGDDTSMEALKGLVVENDFSAQTIQGSFVMSADAPGTVTLSTDAQHNRTASGRVDVSRAAAKIQLFLDIPPTFNDEENHTWEPVLSAGVTITVANAVKRGKVDGEYSVQSSDYITYDSRVVTELRTEQLIPGYEGYKYTHIPFYSYPSAWSDLSDYACSIIFRIAWKRTEADSDSYIWKKYQLSPNATQNLLRNHFYRTFVAVHSLGGADKESIVTIPEADYVIIPWMNESAGVGQGIVPGELITYKYLVVDEPKQVLNNEETAYFTYVTSSPLSSIKISKIEYYDNMQANPLQTDPLNTTVTADRQTVPTSAGDISVSKETPGLVTFYHSVSNMYSAIKIYATITNGDACTQDIVIEQNPSISLVRNTKAGNVFVNGYFARVSPAPPVMEGSNTYRYNNSGYFWHSASFWSTGNTTAGQTNNTSKTVSGRRTGTYGTIMGSINNLSSSIDRNFYTTYVSVTSFNDSNDYYVANGEQIHYRIGDPRVPSVTHYSGSNSWTDDDNFYDYMYYNGNTTERYAAWSDPENILIASQSEDGRSIIAPHILVSSALNANTGLTFDQAVKRGATYQEAGYPAGRWRLPSEAEIAFIVARQRDGVIPVLYATGSYYWSGSGRLVYIPTNSSAAITFAAPSTADGTNSCRFVYDLWYWGDKPAATNVYHPNGHNTDY